MYCTIFYIDNGITCDLQILVTYPNVFELLLCPLYLVLGNISALSTGLNFILVPNDECKCDVRNCIVTSYRLRNYVIKTFRFHFNRCFVSATPSTILPEVQCAVNIEY